MIPSPGRMIRTDISKSDKYAELTPPAAVLFAMLIPHYNSHGKMQAEPYTIKGTVCPKVPYIVATLPANTDEIEQIEAKYGTCPRLVSDLLTEITEKTNVKWFKAPDGIHYIHSLKYEEHQKLTKKKGEDRLPSFPGEQVDDLSETSPGEDQVQDLSETSQREVAGEVEVEVEGRSGSGSGRKKEKVKGVASPRLGDADAGGGDGSDAGDRSRRPGVRPAPARTMDEAQALASITGKAPLDLTNPTHLDMIETLDRAGIDTTAIETYGALRIAYDSHIRMKNFEKERV
jgi:hypothetical protein